MRIRNEGRTPGSGCVERQRSCECLCACPPRLPGAWGCQEREDVLTPLMEPIFNPCPCTKETKPPSHPRTSFHSFSEHLCKIWEKVPERANQHPRGGEGWWPCEGHPKPLSSLDVPALVPPKGGKRRVFGLPRGASNPGDQAQPSS